MKIPSYLVAVLLAVITVNTATADSNVALTKFKQEGSLVYYNGSVTVAGEFWYPIAEGEREVVGDQVCFSVAEKDANLIPREPGDTRSPWFCFKDTEATVKSIGLTEMAKLKDICELRGKAKLEVANYIVDKEESDVNDLADLVKIVEKPQEISVKVLYEGGGSCEE